MKTLLRLLILFIVFSVNAIGQQLTLGFKTGLDIINYKYVGSFPLDDFSPRLSYDIGVLLNYKLTNRIQIQIEPGFIEKGAQLRNINLNERITFKNGFVTTPLVFVANPISRLFIEIGPELGYLVYAKKRETNGKIYDSGDTPTNKLEFSGIFGLSYNFFDNTYLVVRYVNTFTPLYNNIIYADPGPSTTYKIFNKQFSIGLRYLFNKHNNTR
ncbi:MAG: PorT family protein [Bacteroidetes bacterium]|nr:MAG: PorT family protein [Bacteroidota bacterium]